MDVGMGMMGMDMETGMQHMSRKEMIGHLESRKERLDEESKFIAERIKELKDKAKSEDKSKKAEGDSKGD